MKLQSSTKKSNFLMLFWQRWIVVFFGMFVLSFPLGLQIFPDIGKYISDYFQHFYTWFFWDVLGVKYLQDYTIASDTIGLYFHVLVLSIISFLISFLWTIFKRNHQNHQQFYFWFKTFAVYYLAFILMIYGFNKIFKWQFYLPEPNILYTNAGKIPRDLLYWSVMGTSYSYNIFMGILELFAAVLLFFKPSRFLGCLMAFGLFLNIFLINISFDISVKLFSIFLLFYTLVLISSEWKRLFLFLFGNKFQSSKSERKSIFFSYLPLYVSFKILIIGLLFWEVLSVYYSAKNFNDDKAIRPKFHGAYDVKMFQKNQDTIPLLITDNTIWKRVFIHRQGYLIIEKMNEEMQDFQMAIDTNKQKIIAISDKQTLKMDYKNIGESLTEFSGIIGADTLFIKLQKNDLKQLPLLQNEFHWMINQ